MAMSDAVGQIVQKEHKLDPQLLQVGEAIGDGITSVVYRGSYRDVPVAVKEITNYRQLPHKANINLLREIAILQRIDHPHLVQFYGVVDDPVKVLLVSEFCCGGTAFDFIHNSELRLSWHQKKKMSFDVAIGMEYLHACTPPIIHRDLKSLNLLLPYVVDNEIDLPVIKIIDFGLARMVDEALEGNVVMTRDAGTCHWMAPEVFSSNSYARAVDVYSYSMILYEIIMQDIPFFGVPANKLGLYVCRGNRPDLDEIPPTCPAYLYDLMLACWAHDAKERPDFSLIIQALSTERF